MNNKFHIGDYVFASDWCYGEIIDIAGDIAVVQFDTGFGDSTASFRLNELRHLTLASQQVDTAEKKELIDSCVDFVFCLLIAMCFIVGAILAFIFRDWLLVVLCAMIGLISGYNAMKSACKYFVLTQEDDNE